ncbi:MAG: MFS transporter [Burkholderiales bacterium]
MAGTSRSAGPSGGGSPLAFLVFALFAGHGFAAMALMVLPSVAPKAAADYGVDPSLIGYQIAIVSVGLIVSLLFFGNFNRRAGGCRTNQLGHSLVALGMLLVLIPSPLSLVAGSLAIGLGYGLIAPSATYLLMRFVPAGRHAFVISLQQVGVPLGGLLAAVIAPAIAVSAGWRWSCVLSAGLLLAVVALMQLRRKHWDNDRDRTTHHLTSTPLASLQMVWRDPPLRRLALAAAGFCWAQFCVLSYTVVACVETFGLSLVSAGFVLMAVHLTSAVGRVAAGWLADRLRDAQRVLRGIAWVMLGTSLASLGMADGWPLWAIYGLFILHGFHSGAWSGAVLADIGRCAPAGQAGAAVNGTLVYLNLGKLVGPVLLALIYGATRNYGVALASMVIPATVALWCLRARETGA